MSREERQQLEDRSSWILQKKASDLWNSRINCVEDKLASLLIFSVARFPRARIVGFYQEPASLG